MFASFMRFVRTEIEERNKKIHSKQNKIKRKILSLKTKKKKTRKKKFKKKEKRSLKKKKEVSFKKKKKKKFSMKRNKFSLKKKKNRNKTVFVKKIFFFFISCALWCPGSKFAESGCSKNSMKILFWKQLILNIAECCLFHRILKYFGKIN